MREPIAVMTGVSGVVAGADWLASGHSGVDWLASGHSDADWISGALAGAA